MKYLRRRWINSSPTDLIGLPLHVLPILLLTYMQPSYKPNGTPRSAVTFIYRVFSLLFLRFYYIQNMYHL